MGKEWHWGGRSSKRGGEAQTEIPSGCMCAVFQAFDFHPFHFSINHQPSSFKSRTREDHTLPKGAEGPRHSLESEDGTTVSSISKEANFKIPKNIQIRTRGSTGSKTEISDLSSEISVSPGTKTPTLVARLMGLDLLPDAHSPSSPCLSTPNLYGPRQHIKIIKHRNSTGSDFLPGIPKMSSARKSDVEHGLSLQINKENTVSYEDFEVPRFSFSKGKYDENNSRSPSHYAKQIVKQVRESVSRKVGRDITNTIKNRDHGEEECVTKIKFKKTSKTSGNESSPGKLSNSSYSPRLSRFTDTKQKPSTTPSPTTPKSQSTHSVLKPPSPPHAINIETELSEVSTKPKPQTLAKKELQNQKAVTKCKKTTFGKSSTRVNKPPQTSIRNKQEDPFIIRYPLVTKVNDIKTKKKRTRPLSSDLFNGHNTVPNLLPVKIGLSPQKQKTQTRVSDDDDCRDAKRNTQLFSCSRQTYREEAPRPPAPRGPTTCDHDKFHGAFTTISSAALHEGPEFHYVTTILTRTTGSHSNATTHIPHLHFQWFSPTHPLDPSLFHSLERYPTSHSFVSFLEDNKDCVFERKHGLGPRCNRRLLFDLVDELLSEILVRPKRFRGRLLETVWERVRSLPRAKCEVLEDIDGLVEMEEMREEEEEEGLVKEIERNIVEWLVHETLTVMVGGVDTLGTASFGRESVGPTWERIHVMNEKRCDARGCGYGLDPSSVEAVAVGPIVKPGPHTFVL